MTGLLIDYFAGGGGASEGMEIAYGKPVDYAINHDAKALGMHAVNHPQTHHIEDDVFRVDIKKLIGTRPIICAWFSPDCTHHSRAKGGKPVSNKRRGLAWVVLRVASLPEDQRPNVIHLENVPEFAEWCPLDRTGRPDKTRKGETFRLWCGHLEALGYKLEFRFEICWEHVAPTTRKRLVLTARRDKLPIVWPSATYYRPTKAGKRPAGIARSLKPWRTAADCIDWSIPCPSIFERKRPLADATMRRIARGIVRFVLDNPKPFIVRVTQKSNTAPVDIDMPAPTITTAKGGELVLVTPFVAPLTHHDKRRGRSMDEPLPTVTGAHRGELAVIAPFVTKFRTGSTGHKMDEPLHTVTANSFEKRPGGATPLAIVAPTLIQTSYGERSGQEPRALDIEAPLGTVVAGGGKHALVAAFLAQFNNDRGVSPHPGHEIDKPVSVISTKGPHQALVAAHIMSLKGSDRRHQAADQPAPTITAGGKHVAAVSAFLVKYYKSGVPAAVDRPLDTSTVQARFGLVTVMIGGETYAIVDIGMRMLTPRELFRAQGFKDSYIIDPVVNGKRLTKTDQIRMCGNSVPPPLATAIAVANAPPMSRLAVPGEQLKRRKRRA